MKKSIDIEPDCYRLLVFTILPNLGKGITPTDLSSKDLHFLNDFAVACYLTKIMYKKTTVTLLFLWVTATVFLTIFSDANKTSAQGEPQPPLSDSENIIDGVDYVDPSATNIVYNFNRSLKV